MPNNDGMFDSLADSIVKTLTYLVNTYSGVLQVLIYFLMAITFCYALIKVFQAFRVLSFYSAGDIKKRTGGDDFHGSIQTPLSIIAAGFFKKSKKYYDEEQEKEDSAKKVVPPDAFIRDAAFQFGDRYFEEKFLEPISMTANLLPPQGFIGTIIGMVIHFLSNSGTLSSEVTIAGIATALYTTLIALSCFTCLEFFKKIFYSLAQRRIDEGLAAIAEGSFIQPGNPRKDNEN
jgi:biopolymer transport protein ExbB/TolQ